MLAAKLTKNRSAFVNRKPFPNAKTKRTCQMERVKERTGYTTWRLAQLNTRRRKLDCRSERGYMDPSAQNTAYSGGISCQLGGPKSQTRRSKRKAGIEQLLHPIEGIRPFLKHSKFLAPIGPTAEKMGVPGRESLLVETRKMIAGFEARWKN